MRVLIIGYGVVGKNMHKIFPAAHFYDCNRRLESTADGHEYDVAFICVPTEKMSNGKADTSIVESVVKEFNAKVFCIKSTVPPGTTQKLEDQGYSCVFSPEYFGATQHANSYDYDFVILGGQKQNTQIVAELYKSAHTAELKIMQTDSKTAELCKYMENSWLAMKVSFCCEFFRIAENENIDYNELRELWLLDPRINRSHTFVYKDSPFYNSHCLNKDIPAIIEDSISKGYKPLLLDAMEEINKSIKGGL